MKINEFFDSGYYINLDFRSDRNDYITNLFKDIGLYEFVQRVSAIDGTGEVKDYIRQQYCSASHKKVYNIAKKLNYKNFVVFEDDFMLYNTEQYNGLNVIESALDQLKEMDDWDIIYFGGYIFDKTIKKVNTNLLKVDTVLTLHGYGVSESGVDKLLKHEPFTDSALDGWIGDRSYINKYIVYPMASYQMENPSDLDVSNKTPSLDHWETNYIKQNSIII